MGTTADKLNKLKESKAAIKAAIEAKGVTDVGDKLSDYPAKIESISGGSSKIKLQNGMCFGFSSIFDPTLYDISELTNMYNMFSYSTFETLDLSSWDLSKVTTLGYFLFYNNRLKTINLGNQNMKNVNSIDSMFKYCEKLTNLDLSGCSFGTDAIKTNGLFYNCIELNELNLTEIKVKTLEHTFCNCSALTTIDVSKLDTHFCTDMEGAFNSCSNLTTIDISTFDTINVKSMRSMFESCKKLVNLTLPNTFINSSCTNLEYVFENCTALGSNNGFIINGDLSGVTTMYNMFKGCTSLASIGIIDLGHNEKCTLLNLSDCPIIDAYNFIIYNVFDRATAGYTKAFTLTLKSTTKAALTDEQIAEATAKGFTIA